MPSLRNSRARTLGVLASQQASPPCVAELQARRDRILEEDQGVVRIDNDFDGRADDRARGRRSAKIRLQSSPGNSEHPRRLARLPIMPSRKATFALLATVPVLAIGARALSELADEPFSDRLSQPWELGESTSLSVELDGRGTSSLEWSGSRPVGIETRHDLGEGVSLHIGAEALTRVAPGELLERNPGLQAGAAVRAKLDDRWTAGVGAGWRSTATETGLSAVLDADRRSGAFDDGEGVVWLRLSASF